MPVSYTHLNGIMVEHMVRPANFDMQYNHFHQEYEIYLLLRGRRQMFFENRAYEVQAGNLPAASNSPYRARRVRHRFHKEPPDISRDG